jgi:hypothetical protein
MVRTLGFGSGNFNGWELYCGSAKGQKKVNADNALIINRLEVQCCELEMRGASLLIEIRC